MSWAFLLVVISARPFNVLGAKLKKWQKKLILRGRLLKNAGFANSYSSLGHTSLPLPVMPGKALGKVAEWWRLGPTRVLPIPNRDTTIPPPCPAPSPARGGGGDERGV